MAVLRLPGADRPEADERPDGVVSGVLEGLRVEGKPVFSVQYHPEASPGPQDSHYLFERFVKLMDAKK